MPALNADALVAELATDPYLATQVDAETIRVIAVAMRPAAARIAWAYLRAHPEFTRWRVGPVKVGLKKFAEFLLERLFGPEPPPPEAPAVPSADAFVP
jgi:hypothetical protein